MRVYQYPEICSHIHSDISSIKDIFLNYNVFYQLYTINSTDFYKIIGTGNYLFRDDDNLKKKHWNLLCRTNKYIVVLENVFYSRYNLFLTRQFKFKFKFKCVLLRNGIYIEHKIF